MVWRYHSPGDPPKNNFFYWFNLGCQFFFDINRYLGDKYFDMVWGTTFLGTPSNGSPKINFLNGSS